MFSLSAHVFFQLLRRDLTAFWREYPSKLFDTAFLFFTNIVVTAYLMSQEWVSESYGPFILIGAIASFGLIEVVGKVANLIADIDGPRAIAQTLIMPVRSEAVFCYIGIYMALTSMLVSIALFPFGKLLMPTRFELGSISYVRLVPIYLFANLFFGFFSLWITSLLKGIGGINSLWMRIINPLWMFGAYFYSWRAAMDLSPIVGYASLINPMVYIMEGMRAAALGQEGYLPYWICLTMTILFTVACGFHGVQRLKKRLDCV